MQSSEIEFDGAASRKRKSETTEDCSTSISKVLFSASTPKSAVSLGSGLIKQPSDNDQSMPMSRSSRLVKLPLSKTPISRAANEKADTPLTQLLMADNSDDETLEDTLEGKRKCFYETLVLFKEHLQNRLSLVPDSGFNYRVSVWKKSLKKNNIDPKQILTFFQTEMQAFVEMLEEVSEDNIIQTKGMERLATMFNRTDLDISDQEDLEDIHDLHKKAGQRIKGVPKKNQTACRACKEYFIKTEGFNWICPKEECQARKCTKCNEERVIQKKKTFCDPCLKAKK